MLHSYPSWRKAYVKSFSNVPVFIRTLQCDYVLKVDTDMYFTPGFMDTVRKELDGSELYLVERSHPMMQRISKCMPGVGFTLMKPELAGYYISTFDGYEQSTLQRMIKTRKTKLIKNQALHIVYPFWYAERQGKGITKIDLDMAFPGPKSIHCGGPNVEAQLATLEAWYGSK